VRDGAGEVQRAAALRQRVLGEPDGAELDAPASVVVKPMSSTPQRRVMPCAVAGFVALVSTSAASVTSASAVAGPVRGGRAGDARWPSGSV
jgi:hypothetical protein